MLRVVFVQTKKDRGSGAARGDDSLFFADSLSVADAEYEVAAEYIDHGKPPLFDMTGVVGEKA